jgi:[protein-PII] uridylyltransferase
MTRPSSESPANAVSKAPMFSIGRDTTIQDLREHVRATREQIRALHTNGESGFNVVHKLTDCADTMCRNLFEIAQRQAGMTPDASLPIALLALGGYGRGELSPYSDLDVCLIYGGGVTPLLEEVNSRLVASLWDMGLKIGYTLHSIDEALEVGRQDVRAFTSLSQGRLLAGDSMVYARMHLQLTEFQQAPAGRAYLQSLVKARYEGIAENYRDLFSPEPDLKECAGGLRDYHTALWVYMMNQGIANLDDAASNGFISAEDHLTIIEALDFMWRMRNELHFASGQFQDVLSFANQQHLAKFLAYTHHGLPNSARLMQDYYSYAGVLRRFLHSAARTINCKIDTSVPHTKTSSPVDASILDGELFAGWDDENWFAEHPARMMEVYWKCARHHVSLNHDTERHITRNLHLAGDAFRTSEVVRRFFVAICNHPIDAGRILRQMADSGVLANYLPEWKGIQGIIRYEDFHHYPVDEHTLRAIEALAVLPSRDDSASRRLRFSLEHLLEPSVLVMAILFHDLGKAEGDIHVAASVRFTRQICRRINLSPELEERVAFLVEHHGLMTHLSQYRDIDDPELVRVFANTFHSDQQLRELFLLSYADLSAVGPNVWNDWKGTLLLRLYLRAERIITGRAASMDEEGWFNSKVNDVRARVSETIRDDVRDHMESLGDRYYLAFTSEQIALHLECLTEAKESGLAIRATSYEETSMSGVVICTRDRQGLFALLAGSFASQLIDVNGAALFTRPDGYVIDYFTVSEARRRRPLTRSEVDAVKTVLKSVLLEGHPVKDCVESARRRLFALMQPRVPVPTRVDFDNETSKTHTVIDVQTGDRTGLLYDMAHSIAESGLDITTARISTDARRVRDSFYVTKDRSKITEPQTLDHIRNALVHAIHPRSIGPGSGDEQ